MLFPIDKGLNLLPKNGKLFYDESFLKGQDSNFVIQALLNELNFKNDEAVVFGKHHIMNRLTAWVGNEPFIYGYSQIKRKAEHWNSILLEIKTKVELIANQSFNSCLLNYYPTGDDGMGWHADNEKELGQNPIIASISMGAPRKFVFKHNISKEKVELKLGDGSLLLMGGEIQHYWKHSLPKTKKVHKPRLNLTFRTIFQ